VVVEGSGSGMLLRGTVLAPSETLLTGSVLLDGSGDIVCVGCDCSGESAYADATVVDCPDGTISPGLINTHDHIGYTEGAPIDHGSTRYDHRHDWRGSLSTPSNDTNLGREWGEVRMVMYGTTSMVGSGSADGMVRNLDNDSDNGGLATDEVNNQTFPLGDANESYRSNCDWSYSDGEAAVAEESSFVPHTAEGIDDYAAEEFRCMSDGFVGEDLVEENVAHVHAVGLTAMDYYRTARDRSQIIWSPRSNISLYGDTAQVSLFHSFGGVIAIGTDWTYSGSMTTTRELACAYDFNRTYLDGYFSDRDLWEMATVNGAIALGAEAELGALAPGLVGDIAVFDNKGDDPIQAIFDAEAADTVLVLRAGEALYGEADVVSALRSSCDSVTVCGSDRAICTQPEFGVSWGSMSSTLSGAYPAIHCDSTPDDEPTCVPSRPGEYDGSTDSGDVDGDGIEDGADNCPSIFNPPRPMDNNAQADADGDGTGDPCDATPLGTDYDGDGTDNDEDVCPIEDDDQSDADSDGKGDSCDPCPGVANPNSGCPAAVVTITDIQDGTLSDGDGVSVTGAIVTGIDGSGFSAQDPNAASVAYSGVYVYTSSDPGVSIGDEVTVVGTIDEYYDLTEIVASGWSVTGSGSISPEAVSLSQAASEEYEGVLITVTATVTNEDYDCSADVSSCSDTGLWELGGGSGVLLYDRMYDGSDWTNNIGADGDSVTVTGVMGYRYERRRLQPRSSSDF
jgi:cytosine/adenosine deaminase-related metal-dependent hydrolase